MLSIIVYGYKSFFLQHEGEGIILMHDHSPNKSVFLIKDKDDLDQEWSV